MMARQKLWAVAVAAGISAVLLTGCDDPGGSDSPGIEETEFDDNNGIDTDLKDNSRGEDELEDSSDGEEESTDAATEPSE